jgi:hydroxyacylglutathione hydrolase
VESVPTLQDNYSYLLICQATGQAAILDAPEAGPVVSKVRSLGVTVEKIFSTHHHADHCGANLELAAHYQVPVIGHVSDVGRLPGFSFGVREGDQVVVGECQLKVLHIPAHTRGHIAFYCPHPELVLCGDTLFAGGCGRLFEGTPEDLFAALAKLNALPAETLIYCGHEYTESNLRFAREVEPENRDIREKLAEVEEKRKHRAADWHRADRREMTVPTTLAEERRINPFLRAESVQELGRRRSWKDRG